MIRYTLLCDKDHDFESWFPGSDAFEAQAARHLVACPRCGSTAVRKALMAPALSGVRSQDAEPAPARPESVAVMSERDREIRAMLRAMREHVQQHADHVGDRFADEARRMHYGEIEHRSIYGEAKADEIQALHEEGIPFHPLPMLPDERN